jgi:hypothetical protein
LLSALRPALACSLTDDVVMVPACASLPRRGRSCACSERDLFWGGRISGAITIAACISSTLVNGRLSQAFSATQGEFSKMPPNFCTKASRSILLMAAMSGSATAGPVAQIIPPATSANATVLKRIGMVNLPVSLTTIDT